MVPLRCHFHRPLYTYMVFSTHFDILTNTHTHTNMGRENLCHTVIHTFPAEILPKTDLHSYSPRVYCKIFTCIMEKCKCGCYRDAQPCVLQCSFAHTQIFNEKQDSWEVLARVSSISQINVSRLQENCEAPISTQY